MAADPFAGMPRSKRAFEYPNLVGFTEAVACPGDDAAYSDSLRHRRGLASLQL